MFGMKKHMYVDGPGHNEMGKFLRSIIPLVWIKKKQDLILKCGDIEINGGKVYTVMCSDKMHNAINRHFNLVHVVPGEAKINEEPIIFKTNKEMK